MQKRQAVRPFFQKSRENPFLKPAAAILILLGISLWMTAGAADLSPDRMFRIGLKYGSSAPVSVNIFYENGFDYGYYDTDGNTFLSVYQDQNRFISVAKDENLAWQGSSLEAGGGGGNVGAYHIEIGLDFPSAQAADEMAASARSSCNANAFVAWVGGCYRVRVGSYLSADAANNSAGNLSPALAGQPLAVVGGSPTCLTVVDMNTGKIVFEFDNLGSNAALAVKARPVMGQQPTLKNGSTYYYGDFEFKRMKDTRNLIFINVVDIQSYLKGVLPYEMSPDWPLEALKAQAVAARNFAYSNQNKHSQYGFDLCNTQDCQVYYGTNNMSDLTNRAVDETYGQLLTYNGEVAELFYHSSSGGYTENVENVWVTPKPYLVGVEAPFEDLSRAINGIWSYTVTKAELADLLRSKGYQIGTIADVYVHKYTPVGNTYGVTVVDTSGRKITLEKETMRIRLSPYVKSQHFDVLPGNVAPLSVNTETTTEPLGKMSAVIRGGEVVQLPLPPAEIVVMTKNGREKITQPTVAGSSTVTFSGKGWGNNVGLSQWSARGMAEHGYTYDQILTHFFVGTQLTAVINK